MSDAKESLFDMEKEQLAAALEGASRKCKVSEWGIREALERAARYLRESIIASDVNTACTPTPSPLAGLLSLLSARLAECEEATP